MDDAGNAETALRLCPLSADVDEEPATKYDDFPPTLLVRPLRQKGFAMEDHHRRRDQSKTTIFEVQLDYMLFVTTAGQNSTEAGSIVTILHAVDIVTLMRPVVVGQKCVIERVLATIVSFLDDLGCQRILMKRDNEPCVTALTHENSRGRQADTGWTTILE